MFGTDLEKVFLKKRGDGYVIRRNVPLLPMENDAIFRIGLRCLCVNVDFAHCGSMSVFHMKHWYGL